MGEQQAGWASDVPDFECLEAGPFVLEVARGRDGTFRWSTAVRLGQHAEHILSRGEGVSSRDSARFQATFAARRWLYYADAALPTVDAAAASLRTPTPPCCESCGDQDDGCEDCNGAA